MTIWGNAKAAATVKAALRRKTSAVSTDEESDAEEADRPIPIGASGGAADRRNAKAAATVKAALRRRTSAASTDEESDADEADRPPPGGSSGDPPTFPHRAPRPAFVRGAFARASLRRACTGRGAWRSALTLRRRSVEVDKGAAGAGATPAARRRRPQRRGGTVLCEPRLAGGDAGAGDPSRADSLDAFDVEIAGRDGAAVKAVSLLLVRHSSVFEDIFYPRDESEATYPKVVSPSEPRRVHVEFASQSTLEAIVHFCAAQELPPDLEAEANAANVRTLSQIHLFARLFRMFPLVGAADQAARKMTNRDPTLLCAAFDEGAVLSAAADAADDWGLAIARQDGLGDHVLACVRESPTGILLGPGPEPGVAFLGASSIEAIVRDGEMNAVEYDMWRILNSWVERGTGTEDDRIAHAKSLAHHIQLVLIDPVLLGNRVRKCAFVDSGDVNDALKEIESMSNSGSLADREYVTVEGAGDNRVNGVYFLADDEIGLKADEVMFIKEAEEDRGIFIDFGLYLWGDRWGISSSTEYFNLLYSCKLSARKGHIRKRPPKWGWKCETGAEGPPMCIWKPSKAEDNVDPTKAQFAPALSEFKTEEEEVCATTRNFGSMCGYAAQEAYSAEGRSTSLTLDDMMALPEDEQSFRYASAPKDLDAMMNRSVDISHDDEEAGYNINYMSAALFCDASGRELQKTLAKS